MESNKKYKEYADIFQRFGGKGFLKVKPSFLEGEKVIFEFVATDSEKKAVKGGEIKIYLDTNYALAIATLINSNMMGKLVCASEKGFETPLGGSEENGKFVSRHMVIQRGQKSDFCLTAIKSPAKKKEEGNGKILYVPDYSDKSKIQKINVPFSTMELYMLASALQRAVTKFDIYGLNAFVIGNEEVSEEELPTPSGSKIEPKEEISATTFTTAVSNEEEDLPSPNFSDDDDEEITDFNSFVNTVRGNGERKEKSLVLLCKGMKPDNGGISIGTTLEDGKEGKPLFIASPPEKGTPLFMFLTTLQESGMVKTKIRINDTGDKYEFVAFE